MESYRLVLPEHLNHYGYLFGGNLLKWIDEISWIAATLDYPGCKFVTAGMDKVEFRKSIREGAIIRFEVEKSRVGSTSVQYSVTVYSDDIDTGKQEAVFSTHVTFVCLNDEGKKTALPVKETSVALDQDVSPERPTA
ncbi:MAG: acyl-CoA thioesterase [Gammaproteobacteria bacterium]